MAKCNAASFSSTKGRQSAGIVQSTVLQKALNCAVVRLGELARALVVRRASRGLPKGTTAANFRIRELAKIISSLRVHPTGLLSATVLPHR